MYGTISSVLYQVSMHHNFVITSSLGWVWIIVTKAKGKANVSLHPGSRGTVIYGLHVYRYVPL